MKRMFLFTTLFLVFALQPCWGAVPEQISYQGVLTDASGVAVSDGNYNLTFKLYDAETGGTLLREEMQTVPVKNGIFNVILGKVNPLTLPFDKPYWLGISVNGGAELMPRTPLTAAPYSLNTRGGGGNHSHHSLDAADGGPTDVVSVDGNGIVTINRMLNIIGPSPDTHAGWEGVLSVQSSERGYGSGPPVSFTALEDMEGNTAFLGIGSKENVPQIGGGGQPFIIFGLPTGSDVPVLYLDQHGTGPFLVCGNPAAPPTLVITKDGHIGIGVNSFAPTHPITHVSGAHLTQGGIWTNASSRHLKENFTSVDRERLLEQIDQLPITIWNYKAEGESVKHIGPTAQDFYAFFGLGNSDTSISTVDPAGLALAAIQELKRRNDQLAAENQALRARVERAEGMERRLAELETLVKSLAGRSPSEKHPVVGTR